MEINQQNGQCLFDNLHGRGTVVSAAYGFQKGIDLDIFGRKVYTEINKKGSKMRPVFITLLFGLFSIVFPQKSAYIISIDGVINPVSQEFIHNTLETAAQKDAACVIMEMDTPGGLMQSMRMIVKDMLASPVPVIVYVAPSGSRAGSAGVFITIAANVAAMAPGTNIGAAHPVTMGGRSDSSSTMMEKVTNDAVAFIKSIAQKRGHNAEWAEKAVRESASITETEALKLGVIDLISPSVDSLLAQINGRETETARGKIKINTENVAKIFIKKSFRYRILELISDPNIAYILMLAGIYGLFFELYNPGAIFPGVIGVISLILAFYAFQTLPVNYAGVLLILVAVVLFILEVKIPSHGLLSMGGITSMVLGSLMLFNSPLPFFRVSWSVIAVATISTALFFLFAVGLAIRAQRRKPTTGREGLVGEIGEALEDFKGGQGQVLVHGEIWRAKCAEKVHKGDLLVVEKVQGMEIRVRLQKS